MAQSVEVPTIIKAIDQITVTDITDNYFVELSKDSYVFTGDSSSGASSGSCSVIIKVYRGGEELKKKKTSSDPYPALYDIATSFSDSVIKVEKVSGSGAWSGDTWTPYQFTISIKSGQTLSVAKEIPFTATIDFSDDNTDDITLTKTFTVTTTKKGADGTSIGISATHIYYGYSTNGTQPTSVTNWQENVVPTVPNNNYLWTKTVVIYDDDPTTPTTTTTYSASYKAIDGTSQYTFIRYAPTGDTSQDDMTTSPQSNTKYIGVVVVTTNSAPTTKSSYTWSKYVGDSATQYYTHVMYATNAQGANISSSPTGKTYMGVRVDTSETASTTPSDYTWTKFVGDNGTSSYTYIRYSADDVTTSGGAAMYETPQADSLYIGLNINSSSTAPTTKSSYTWSKFIGDDGTDGFSIWTTTAAVSSSKFNISALNGPTGQTPKVNEIVISKNRYQYTITAVSSTQVTVNSGVDLKGSNGTSITWKGDLASAPSNPQLLWAYYNTTDKKSYVYNGSSWDTMTNDGNNATQYYYHVVYCNNTSTGAGYSTTPSNQTYTGTYIDTTQADAATWASLPSGVKWNYTKGDDGEDGYNVATVNVYQCAASKPAKPYASTSGTITYTFSTNSFSPALSGWSLTYPSVGSGNPVWVSTISLTSQSSSVTIDKTKFSDPVIVADETQAVYISASADTFKSSDGGNTYTPTSITLTPRFQNCTYNKWYYLNPSTSAETEITNQTGLTINSNTKVLTIQNITTSTSPFYSVDALTFKCEAYIGTSSSNTKVSDYFTVVKVRDGAGISSVEIKYAQSSSGTTPPSASSSDWKDTVAAVGTIPAGSFLWTRTKFNYTDGTSSDYTYTKAMQGLTGKGIDTVTPLHYLCGPIIDGYKSGSNFYEDENHTKLITPVANNFYHDKTSGAVTKYYQYKNSSYTAVSSGPPKEPPAKPNTHVTETGTGANVWTTGVPKYVTGGKYYICEEIKYTDNTYSWSTPVLDNIVTDAYMEIDSNTGQINIISEQILNLEQTDIGSGSVTFTKDCYVGTLHKLVIKPTSNSGPGSIHVLYPRTDLYPSTSLYPGEAILVIDCGNTPYGTKYQYRIDIDGLNYTSSTVYDEFVYEDGKCWIVRRTGSSETIEARNPLTPVNPVIDVGGEEIQVSDSILYIPQKTNVTIRLLGVNEAGSSSTFKCEATYLIDNVYTSNFTSSYDLISQINMSPGNIKIKANNIALEGYTTINEGFKIDLQGNMECQNANINGSLVTKDGVLTNIMYRGDFWAADQYFGGVWENPKKYLMKEGNTLSFIGFNTSFDGGSTWTFWYEFLNFPVLIPENFTPITLRVIVRADSVSLGWSKTGSDWYEDTTGCNNVGLRKVSNLEQANMLVVGGGSQMDGCVPIFNTITNIPTYNFPKGASTNHVFEGDATTIFTDGPGLYNIALMTTDAVPGNVSGGQSAADTAANYIKTHGAVVNATCEVIGYMQISTEEGE